jgi:Peptidase family M23
MAQTVNSKLVSAWLPNGGTISQGFNTQEFIPSLGINAPHEGVDIATPIGSPLTLPSNVTATVQKAGWDPFGGGNFIQLELADGSVIQLFHLQDTLVKAGQDLTGGTLLGHTGSTGASTGPHLHFQVNESGKPVDPWAWLTGLGSAAAPNTGGSLNPFDAVKNVNDFFGHLVSPGHDPCSAPSSEMGVFKVIDAVTCPQNWWKVGFVGLGTGLILFGFVIYFFQQEKAAATVVIRDTEEAAVAA